MMRCNSRWYVHSSICPTFGFLMSALPISFDGSSLLKSMKAKLEYVLSRLVKKAGHDSRSSPSCNTSWFGRTTWWSTASVIASSCMYASSSSFKDDVGRWDVLTCTFRERLGGALGCPVIIPVLGNQGPLECCNLVRNECLRMRPEVAWIFSSRRSPTVTPCRSGRCKALWRETFPYDKPHPSSLSWRNRLECWVKGARTWLRFIA